MCLIGLNGMDCMRSAPTLSCPHLLCVVWVSVSLLFRDRPSVPHLTIPIPFTISCSRPLMQQLCLLLTCLLMSPFLSICSATCSMKWTLCTGSISSVSSRICGLAYLTVSKHWLYHIVSRICLGFLLWSDVLEFLPWDSTYPLRMGLNLSPLLMLEMLHINAFVCNMGVLTTTVQLWSAPARQDTGLSLEIAVRISHPQIPLVPHFLVSSLFLPCLLAGADNRNTVFKGAFQLVLHPAGMLCNLQERAATHLLESLRWDGHVNADIKPWKVYTSAASCSCDWCV